MNKTIFLAYDIYLTLTEGQCDACPPGTMTVSPNHAINPASEYVAAKFDAMPLGNDFSAIYAPELCFNPIVANQSALSLIQDFQRPKSLDNVYLSQTGFYDNPSDNALKKLIELNLLLPANRAKTQFSENSDTLTASLHLADSCNLACDYCYLPNSKSHISLETGIRIINKVINSAVRHQYQQVKIKYTGGEPLFGFDLIAVLHRYAKESACRNQLELSGSVLSNGTLLTPEIIEQIKALNLRLMISLDGIHEYHDCHRHYPDGSGSFGKVSHAIDTALAQSLIPDISVTVSARNAAGLPELMQWILDRDLPFSLNFYRENSKSEKYSDLRIKEEKIIQGMLAAYRVIESHLPSRSLLSALADRTNLAVPHLRACSAAHSYLVFDCQGNISKCQMQMDAPVTDILNPDPLKALRNDRIGLQNLKVDDKEECKSCKWKYWCGGGCPLETFRCSGRYDKKSPNCNIYKVLFPQIIRLEGLRLLKHGKLSEF